MTFDLSEEIIEEGFYIPIEKVKEFIRREDEFEVKDIDHMSEEFKLGACWCIGEMKKERHKLAGEKLT